MESELESVACVFEWFLHSAFLQDAEVGGL